MQNINSVGPLEVARENLEKFADSLVQHHMLLAIVEAYRAQDLLKLEATDAVMKDLEAVWTAAADRLRDEGVSA